MRAKNEGEYFYSVLWNRQPPRFVVAAVVMIVRNRHPTTLPRMRRGAAMLSRIAGCY